MYVLGLAPKRIGGMERFLRALAVEMNASGWDCVFCFDGDVSEDFRLYISGLNVSIESVCGQHNLGLGAAGTLWHVLRKHRPTTFAYAFHGVLRCFPWLARMSGCRDIFFNDHSSRDPSFVARKMSLPKRLIGNLLTLPLKGVVSVSQFTLRSGESLGLTSAPRTVIYNGVELRDLDEARGDAFRRRYQIPQNVPLVTLVAWMVPVKGIDVALNAARLVLDSHTPAHFLFVGEGPSLEAFRKLAEDLKVSAHVTFTGEIHNPVEEGVFDATDIYLQTTRWQESSGLAVLEAMALGCPVLASNIGGLPELIKNDDSGFLVPSGDAEMFAEKLILLLPKQIVPRGDGKSCTEYCKSKPSACPYGATVQLSFPRRIESEFADKVQSILKLMSEEDLKQRLTYFEEKLDEAMRRSFAKERLAKTFSAGFTTAEIKSWPETIALIKERIARIKEQLIIE